jgi:hypothetical protein
MFRDMARRVPREHVGEAAFAHWLLNAGDRHVNNYLWSDGQVIPIDYGAAIYPTERTSSHWRDEQDALREAAGYGEGEWGDLPIPRHVAEAAVGNRDPIMALVENHAAKHHGGWLTAYPKRHVLRSFEGKLDAVARALQAAAGSPTLRQLGIDGTFNTPGTRQRLGREPGGVVRYAAPGEALSGRRGGTVGVLRIGFGRDDLGTVEFRGGEVLLRPNPGHEDELKERVEGWSRALGHDLENWLAWHVGKRHRPYGFWVEFADGRPNPKKWSQFDGVPEDVPRREGESLTEYAERLLALRP